MKESLIRRCSIVFIMMAAAFAMCAAMVTPAFAANTPVNGGTFNFNKYLVMDANANVPNATFEFTITAGAAVDATDATPAIYAGNDVNRTSNFQQQTVQVQFTPDDQKYDTVQSSDTVVLESNENYAKKTGTVDLTSVEFKAPGIYRYIITETSSSRNGIANDTTATRTLDVHVSYAPDSNDQLVVSGYTLYPGTKTDAVKVSEENKDDGFTNTYTTYDLTLSKKVTGNQGDRDKEFMFTVNITNAVEGTKYTVLVPESAPDTLAADEYGNVSKEYSLKHDQSITIQGLTAGTNYTITENSYATDGYTTSYKIDNDSSVTASSTNEQTMGDSDHTVAFTNDKKGTVPTGILLETAPYIGLGVAVIAGLALLFATRRRRAGE
mgnify:CR=1 FL=1